MQSFICLTNWKRYRPMKYIFNAFWKHDTPINAEEAIDYMMIIRDTFDFEKTHFRGNLQLRRGVLPCSKNLKGMPMPVKLSYLRTESLNFVTNQ